MANKIFINTSSFGHNSISKWNKVAAVFPDLKPVFLAPADISPSIAEHLKSNDTLIIGGGDGSLHHAINCIDNLDRVRIGGLGLGSSCSFLKSFSKRKQNAGIPALLDFKRETKIDIGQVTFKNKEGLYESKYFLANGSLGFLALGNLIFNKGSGLVGTLKKLSTEVANTYVFAKSLFSYQPVGLSVNGQPLKKYLNVQFLKAKYYTGDFYFDRGNTMDSGLIDFHYFDYLGKLNTLNVFFNLSLKNEYRALSHTENKDKFVTIKSETVIPLELDGEIYYGTEFQIECLPKKLNILGGETL